MVEDFLKNEVEFDRRLFRVPDKGTLLKHQTPLRSLGGVFTLMQV